MCYTFVLKQREMYRVIVADYNLAIFVDYKIPVLYM